MKISFSAPSLPKSGAIAVGVLDDRKLTPSAAELDKTAGGALSRAIKASRFKGKKGQHLEVLAVAGLEASRVLLFGMGKAEELGDTDLDEVGGSIVAKMNEAGEKEVAVYVDEIKGTAKTSAERAARHAFGARLRGYRFDRHKTKEEADSKPSLSKVTFMLEDHADAKKAYKPLDKVTEGVFLTRDVVSEPANLMYPETFVNEAKKLEKLGVELEVLDEKDMKKLGMGSLLCVSQGSERPPRLLIMRWKGGKGKDAPVAFVGKGVTFDTGGISLKPAAGMEDMKWDMAGAGVVLGLMKALAGRKAKMNAVGVCGLVENMPSGKATRPGDIVKSMSGQTIEVLNTDAEGRLVLADALWYVQETDKPNVVIDLATLTGAIIVALGSETAGLFSNSDELAGRLTDAGKAVGEPIWRLPLGETYDKQLDCDAADMKNIGGNREAGSIVAAQFLQRFIKKDVEWAHLDIAGVTWSKKDKPTVPKGSTAFGVRLLERFVTENYEN
ncbi:MAG: leucyl aminopeptidase [Rhodovibrionaceae bacterium]|nr:leucyl aminopeptidase [Rhodovibrionaceae bacterium]